MAGDGGCAAGNGLHAEDSLRREVERDCIFGCLDAGLQQGVVQVGENVDGEALFGLVGEAVGNSFVIFLLVGIVVRKWDQEIAVQRMSRIIGQGNLHFLAMCSRESRGS